MSFKSVAKKLAGLGLPLLGTALGGPAGSMAAQAVGTALGLSTVNPSPEDLNVALGKVSGDQLVRLREVEANLAREKIQSATKIALGQIDLNVLYARRKEFWHSGGRPAALWICVAGLGYTFLVKPLLPWIVEVTALAFGSEAKIPPLPPLDTGELFALLGGLLGLGTMRSVERIKDKA